MILSFFSAIFSSKFERVSLFLLDFYVFLYTGRLKSMTPLIKALIDSSVYGYYAINLAWASSLTPKMLSYL